MKNKVPDLKLEYERYKQACVELKKNQQQDALSNSDDIFDNLEEDIMYDVVEMKYDTLNDDIDSSDCDEDKLSRCEAEDTASRVSVSATISLPVDLCEAEFAEFFVKGMKLLRRRIVGAMKTSRSTTPNRKYIKSLEPASLEAVSKWNKKVEEYEAKMKAKYPDYDE